MSKLGFSSLEIDQLTSDLVALAQFGAVEGGGITRIAYSPAYKEAQAWLMSRMQDAGMTVRLDYAGNIIGRMGPPNAPAIACGSHIDTVPGGGAYDGSLGVLAGISVAKALSPKADQLPIAFEVIAFSDEEGAFLSEAGARAMTGTLTTKEIEENIGRDGRRMTTALEEFGLKSETFASAEREPSDLAAYLELHIEQGPILESEGMDIGIVEGITGIHTSELVFSGQANHAGTTPIDMRQDAFRAAAEAISACFEKIERSFPDETRLTFGKVQVEPGATNVVPSSAIVAREIRGGSEALISSVAEETTEIAKSVAAGHGVALKELVTSREAPAIMSEGVMRAIETACSNTNAKFKYMKSGAGHDAQIIAGFCPTGMIFVPSRDGVSHNPAEFTSPAQIEKGARVLLATVRILIREAERQIKLGY